LKYRKAMKNAPKLWLSILLALAGLDRAGAAEQEAIAGILVNQTVTVAGQEFHAAFAAVWADKPEIAGYGLAIRERPSARRGTTVEVEHANRIVFRAWLPPVRSQIRPLAEQAVEMVYENAVAAQVQLLLRDDDLAPDEI
jgi:curli production assembly/transport component CsgE